MPKPTSSRGKGRVSGNSASTTASLPTLKDVFERRINRAMRMSEIPSSQRNKSSNSRYLRSRTSRDGDMHSARLMEFTKTSTVEQADEVFKAMNPTIRAKWQEEESILTIEEALQIRTLNVDNRVELEVTLGPEFDNIRDGNGKCPWTEDTIVDPPGTECRGRFIYHVGLPPYDTGVSRSTTHRVRFLPQGSNTNDPSTLADYLMSEFAGADHALMERRLDSWDHFENGGTGTASLMIQGDEPVDDSNKSTFTRTDAQNWHPAGGVLRYHAPGLKK